MSQLILVGVDLRNSHLDFLEEHYAANSPAHHNRQHLFVFSLQLSVGSRLILLLRLGLNRANFRGAAIHVVLCDVFLGCDSAQVSLFHLRSRLLDKQLA